MNVTMIDNMRQYFSTQPIKKAWLFGSFSRGEETADSDIDILVEFEAGNLSRYSPMQEFGENWKSVLGEMWTSLKRGH